MRADLRGVIVPNMAGRANREIRDQDVQGLKCLRKIRPLLSRLRKVGTERDRAGNRRLFMDQYCALILMSLFSPAIESLRDLQRACALDKVRKRLGVSRASLGSLSESVAIFDPAPLKEIAIELGHTIRSKPNSQFAAVGQPITAVDGTVIATVKRVAELSWTPKAKHLSAYRLHTHFELLSGKAVRNGVGGQRSLEGESADTSERTEVRMTAVSVRREGVGSPSPRTTWIGLPCIRRAEQDCREGRGERPATGHGQPRAARPDHRRLKTCGHVKTCGHFKTCGHVKTCGHFDPARSRLSPVRGVPVAWGLR